MKPSSEHDAGEALPDFDLPDGEDFPAFPPRLSMDELNRRWREIRERFPHLVPTAEERWARKVDVPFEL